MKHLELFNRVQNKFKEVVIIEGGLIYNDDVLCIEIPSKLKSDFFYFSEETFFISAKELISKSFPESNISFSDIEDIRLHYKVVKHH